MAAKPTQSSDSPPSATAKKAARAERQGAALRANLRRRKDQARRRTGTDVKMGMDKDGADAGRKDT